MLYVLEKKDYSCLRSMLEAGFQFPEVEAVVNSINSGWIATDDPNYPASAFLWAEGLGGFFLLGDETNVPFLHALDHYIDFQLKNSRFEVSGMHKGWDRVIERQFARRNVKKSTQLIYKWHERSLDQFKEHGIAYCALQENRIASICYSGFVAGQTHTLGIQTLEPFRQQGLAYWTAQACIRELRNRKLSPYWDCSSGNVASCRLAEKLGFHKTEEYNLYSIKKE